MAETGQKISALQAATSAADADVLAGVQSNATKKFSFSVILNYIKSKLLPADIGAVPNTRTVNSKALSSDIALTAADVGAATTADIPVAYATNPEMDGAASAGSSTAWARGDHVHPSDSSKADNDIVAVEYDSSATYAFGDYCIYDGGFYRCIYPITTAESWTAAHWVQTTIAAEIEFLAAEHHVYGFHVDGAESDPATAVTYLADAVGMTPAAMDFVNSNFKYGSWQNAFFLPRPCMLKYNGTVDYYLDPNDYSKKADGTASDVADDTYGGNAMMEWGRDGRKIWYKIVPDDGDSTSASVYIADYQADGDYHAWSFINNQGILVDHFYTPIYNGSIDSGGRLRSISGKASTALCQSKTAAEEVTAAELNNPASDKLWYTEVYADVTLVNLLLILMGKSLHTQSVFGNGYCGQIADTPMLGTGTLDANGLFFGYNDNAHAVKVFGMENWWGNQYRRYAGHVMVDYAQKYKMTRGNQDGSTAIDYSQSSTPADYSGYLSGVESAPNSGYVAAMQFFDKTFQAKATGGTSATYWCDYWYRNSSLRYASRGGATTVTTGYNGAFMVRLNVAVSAAESAIGAAVSCKPLA